MSTRKAQFYSLVAELSALRVHGRLIARILGASSGYVAEAMGELGLGQRFHGRDAETVVSTLPSEVRERISQFRGMPERALPAGANAVTAQAKPGSDGMMFSR